MEEREQILAAIAALEAQRNLLGEAVVETALGPLRAKLAALDTPVTEQRKHVTILFADVQGFTTLSETLDPEDVTHLMNLGWQKFDGAIQAHGGWIDKHIGDAVMALWGVEQAHENDAERAVRAALAMQAALHEWRQSRQTVSATAQPLIENLQIRIGLHTGPVVLSQVGSKGEYTALGDSVNVAARLEHAAPPGGVLISHATYAQVRGLFEVEPQAPLTVKGKSEPLQTYLVKRAQPRTFWVERRGVEGTRTALVGREAELAQLHTLRLALRTAPGWRAVALVGEAGLGKSRLLFEFENQLQGETSLRARADESLQLLPLSLLRDLYLGWFNIHEDDTPAEVQTKIEQGVSAYLGATSIAQAHYLGQMAGFDFTHSPYIRPFAHDVTYLRQCALQAERALFEAVGQRGPVVLLIEDLHWADTASLNWLLTLAEQVKHLPILLVVTTRSMLWREHPDWMLPVERLNLTALTQAQCQVLAEALVPTAHQLPPAVIAQAIAQAEGNPYYLEELLKMLLETGVQGAQIPGTLAGVLQARLERLQPAEQNVIQRSAVVGRVFWDEAVAQLQSAEAQSPETLTAILSTLQERELVLQNPEAAFAEVSEFWFKHALLREVAYDRVLKATRPGYHRRAAEWLIARSGERVNEYASLIAEHYERAGETARAAQWHAQAGQAAYATHAMEAARHHCQKALALWDFANAPTLENLAHTDLPFIFAALNTLGNALLVSGNKLEANHAHQQSLHLAQHVGNPDWELQAYEGLIFTSAERHVNLQIQQWGQAAEQLARQHLAQLGPARLARALYLKGISLPPHHIHELVALAQEGTELAVQAHDLARQGDHLHLLGLAYVSLGELHQAVAVHQKSLKIWQTLGHKAYASSLSLALGENYRLQGEYAQAEAWYQTAAQLARAVGDVYPEIISIGNNSFITVHRQHYAAAITQLQSYLQNPDAPMPAEVNLYLALALAHQQQVRAASTTLTTAAQLLYLTEDMALEGLKWQIAGHIAAQAGGPVTLTLDLTQGEQTYTAEASFAKAVQTFETYYMQRNLAVALGEWARYAQHQGQTAQATALRTRARAILEKLNLPRLIEELEAD